MTMTMEGETTGLLRLCVPPAVTRKQLVEVFYQYAGSNPQLLHKDWHYVAWLSLKEAFPC
ncbi:Rap1a/Tai family immunity protein [Tabrizicola sp. M-4]|uniref:Rap1a/Tai family immunity protein n=1 Tax=Tabrizicola sp. M-4 TaxID=3055847 RepID=UPI003DA9E752